MELPEYPPKVDIKTQIYEPLPKTAKALSSWETLDASEIGRNLVAGLSTALRHGNRLDVETFFAIPSAHWRDTLALTAHLRTFSGRERISSTLLELCIQRGAGGFEFHGGQVVAANEDLVGLSFTPPCSRIASLTDER